MIGRLIVFGFARSRSKCVFWQCEAERIRRRWICHALCSLMITIVTVVTAVVWLSICVEADDSDDQTVLGIPRLSPPAGQLAVDEVQHGSADVSNRMISVQDVFPLFSGDSSLEGVDPISDDLGPMGILAFIDYDAFRGVPDQSWENNGIRVGFNFATQLGQLSEATGVGFQAGSSIGVYDWGGTDYRLQNQNQAQTQGFFTYGLYRKPNENSRITGGLVQDISVNANYGIFAQSPVLSQLRGQIGYATSASNEFGIWGTAHLLSSTHDVPGQGAVTWRTINQLSGYWHHKWSAGGADTWVSAGLPSYDRLAGGGSVGDYLVTATAACPLSDFVAIYSSVTYMHQSAGIGPKGADDEAWNFTVGITIYPMRNARSSTVAGQPLDAAHAGCEQWQFPGRYEQAVLTGDFKPRDTTARWHFQRVGFSRSAAP